MGKDVAFLLTSLENRKGGPSSCGSFLEAKVSFRFIGLERGSGRVSHLPSKGFKSQTSVDVIWVTHSVVCLSLPWLRTVCWVSKESKRNPLISPSKSCTMQRWCPLKLPLWRLQKGTWRKHCSPQPGFMSFMVSLFTLALGLKPTKTVVGCMLQIYLPNSHYPNWVPGHTFHGGKEPNGYVELQTTNPRLSPRLQRGLQTQIPTPNRNHQPDGQRNPQPKNPWVGFPSTQGSTFCPQGDMCPQGNSWVVSSICRSAERALRLRSKPAPSICHQSQKGHLVCMVAKSISHHRSETLE